MLKQSAGVRVSHRKVELQFLRCLATLMLFFSIVLMRILTTWATMVTVVLQWLVYCWAHMFEGDRCHPLE